MGDKSTIGELKAVLENSFAEMQSDENSIKETKKDVVLSPMKPEKIEYGVVYSSENYQEDFIVKPIKATQQTIDAPLNVKEGIDTNEKSVEGEIEPARNIQPIVSAPSKTIGEDFDVDW